MIAGMDEVKQLCQNYIADIKCNIDFGLLMADRRNILVGFL